MFKRFLKGLIIFLLPIFLFAEKYPSKNKYVTGTEWINNLEKEYKEKKHDNFIKELKEELKESLEKNSFPKEQFKKLIEVTLSLESLSTETLQSAKQFYSSILHILPKGHEWNLAINSANNNLQKACQNNQTILSFNKFIDALDKEDKENFMNFFCDYTILNIILIKKFQSKQLSGEYNDFKLSSTIISLDMLNDIKNKYPNLKNIDLMIETQKNIYAYEYDHIKLSDLINTAKSREEQEIAKLLEKHKQAEKEIIEKITKQFPCCGNCPYQKERAERDSNP